MWLRVIVKGLKESLSDEQLRRNVEACGTIKRLVKFGTTGIIDYEREEEAENCAMLLRGVRNQSFVVDIMPCIVVPGPPLTRNLGPPEDEEEDELEFLYAGKLPFEKSMAARNAAALVSSGSSPEDSACIQYGPVGVKVDKNRKYWENKRRAIQRFGTACKEPQDEDRNFLLIRRKINYTFLNERLRSTPTLIASEMVNWNFTRQLTISNIQSLVLPPKGQKNVTVIDMNNLAKLPDILADIYGLGVVALDLEAHDEHSYLGMTCLLQLGYCTGTLVLDTLDADIVDSMTSSVKKIFESDAVVKVVWGSANDMLWLKRDFNINVVAAVDLQIFFKVLVERNLFHLILLKLPEIQVRKWIKTYYNAEVTGQLTEGKLNCLSNKKRNESISYSHIVSLFYPEHEIDKTGQFADFRIRDAQVFQKLVDYASDDVHFLIRIYHSVSQMFGCAPECLEECIRRTKALQLCTYKPPLYNPSTAPISASMDSPTQTLVRIIHEWRDRHASQVDEDPKALFNNAQLIKAVTSRISSIEELVECLGTQSESMETWKKPLFRLLTEGPSFYQKMLDVECTNCLKRGHLHWACDQTFSKENRKAYFNAHPDFKNAENRRRSQNKAENKRKRQV